eukprot:CAMPEP_0168342000 /NCGR_PEP_ID=MMETSP0213-20121227/15080_1 /TAXON_ID=151035 /ORGANISM="Euplotes harpa, Strain FSP1.4" /LENGTH=127 /DNA_ID=CAMNT_0008348707 /DNA_START=11 /DNA_END=390 /DNA_ORIENTATION=+
MAQPPKHTEDNKPEPEVPTSTSTHLRYPIFGEGPGVYSKDSGFVYMLHGRTIEEQQKILRDHIDMIGIHKMDPMKIRQNVYKSRKLVGEPMLAGIYGKFWKRLLETPHPGEIRRKMAKEKIRKDFRT